MKNFLKELEKNKKEVEDLSSLTKIEIETTEVLARVLAMNVRNKMENFHVKHLSDEQMKELNPIIRNAIFSELIIIAKANKGSNICTDMLNMLRESIPRYWEKCKMI